MNGVCGIALVSGTVVIVTHSTTSLYDCAVIIIVDMMIMADAVVEVAVSSNCNYHHFFNVTHSHIVTFQHVRCECERLRSIADRFLK